MKMLATDVEIIDLIRKSLGENLWSERIKRIEAHTETMDGSGKIAITIECDNGAQISMWVEHIDMHEVGNRSWKWDSTK